MKNIIIPLSVIAMVQALNAQTPNYGYPPDPKKEVIITPPAPSPLESLQRQQDIMNRAQAQRDQRFNDQMERQNRNLQEMQRLQSEMALLEMQKIQAEANTQDSSMIYVVLEKAERKYPNHDFLISDNIERSLSSGSKIFRQVNGKYIVYWERSEKLSNDPIDKAIRAEKDLLGIERERRMDELEAEENQRIQLRRQQHRQMAMMGFNPGYDPGEYRDNGSGLLLDVYKEQAQRLGVKIEGDPGQATYHTYKNAINKYVEEKHKQGTKK